MIPTMDIYVLNFNVGTKKGMKSYRDFMGQIDKTSEADKAYMNVHTEDHLGYIKVTMRQFSNRRSVLISVFDAAVKKGLLEDFQVYGN